MTRASAATIRPARPADLPTIGRLAGLLVQMHHSFDAKRFIPATEKTEHAYAGFLETQLHKSSVIVLVAEQGGEIVGYAYAGMEGTDYMSLRGPAGAIYDVVVDPGHRRQRVGRMLLEAAVAELKARGAPRVVLSTAERNESAQHLFASAGFRRTMVEMTLELNSDAS